MSAIGQPARQLLWRACGPARGRGGAVIERIGLKSPEKKREAERGGGIRAPVGRRFEKGDPDAPDTLPDDGVEFGAQQATASDEGASA